MAKTAPMRVESIRSRAADRGMKITDVVASFIDSRRRGNVTARCQASDRTIGEYKSDLLYFATFMDKRGHTHWNDLAREDVYKYIDWAQKKTGWAVATQFKNFRAIKSLFKFIEADDECADYGMRGFLRLLPAIPKAESKLKDATDLPTLQECKDFMDSFDKTHRSGLRNYVMMAMFIDTGLRAGELCYAKLPHLKLDDRKLIVPDEGKTGIRVVNFSTETARDVRTWLHKRQEFAKCDSLFVADTGEAITTNAMIQAFRRQRMRTGIRNTTRVKMSMHLLRHLFSTDWLREGGNVFTLQQMTGHKDLETLKIYSHLSGDDFMADTQQKISARRRLAALERAKHVGKKRVAIS